ncbi:MAG: nucleoside-diphosphate kinase [Microgenomates group bacterium]
MNIETPGVFSSRGLAELTSVALRAEKMSLSELELEKLHKINQVLNHPELERLIDEGNITLGIIKPQANNSRRLSTDDQVAADLIAEEIKDNIVFSLSLKLLPKDVEKFYADAKEKYPEHIWKSIYDFSQSGPLTFLLIYHEDGDAVNRWRKEMGKTHANEADPESIRGKYAIEEELPNNLVHGSDSKEAVKRELGIFRDITAEMEEKSIKVRDSFPSESEFVLNPGERLLAIEKTCAPRKKLPSFVGVIYRDDLIQRRSPEKQLSKAS